MKVALAKVEKEMMTTTDDVVMTDGVKLEFNKDGSWTEVDCQYSAVPAGIVPAQIVQKVADLYPNAKIVKIDRDKKEYEIKLDSKVELTFDMKFNLVEVDH